MTCVMISSRAGTDGATLAAMVAEQLGFRFADLHATLYARASEVYDVPTEQLQRAFEQPPSLFGMSDTRRRRLAVFVHDAIAEHLAQDSAVYHGPFAHLVARGVAHVLKVRVSAPLALRRDLLTRSGLEPLQAERRVRNLDENARRIAEVLYDASDDDEGYDRVVDLSTMTVPQAASWIVDAAQSDSFHTTSYSRRCIREIELAGRLAARLTRTLDVEAEVSVVDGFAKIRASAPSGLRERISQLAESIVRDIGGIQAVHLLVVPPPLRPSRADHRS